MTTIRMDSELTNTIKLLCKQFEKETGARLSVTQMVYKLIREEAASELPVNYRETVKQLQSSNTNPAPQNYKEWTENGRTYNDCKPCEGIGERGAGCKHCGKVTMDF